jgi:hypothetical protein
LLYTFGQLRALVVAGNDHCPIRAPGRRDDTRVKSAEDIVIESVLCCHRGGLLVGNTRECGIERYSPAPCFKRKSEIIAAERTAEDCRKLARKKEGDRAQPAATKRMCLYRSQIVSHALPDLSFWEAEAE